VLVFGCFDPFAPGSSAVRLTISVMAMGSGHGKYPMLNQIILKCPPETGL